MGIKAPYPSSPYPPKAPYDRNLQLPSPQLDSTQQNPWQGARLAAGFRV